MKDLLVALGILILCFKLYRLLRGNWIQRFLKKKKGAAQPRKPQVTKPKSVVPRKARSIGKGEY